MNEIQEIEARLEAATQGPWDVETIPETGESRVVVRSNTGDPMLDVSVAPHGVRAEDAKFIAYAPEDIRALIAEVKRLEAWKREAVMVMDGLQGLGEALRLPLGEQVTGRTALEKVKELIKSRDAWASHMMGIAVTRQKLEAVEALLDEVKAVRDAVARHPDVMECSEYSDDEPVSCGWKRAYEDVVWALNGGKE